MPIRVQAQQSFFDDLRFRLNIAFNFWPRPSSLNPGSFHLWPHLADFCKFHFLFIWNVGPQKISVGVKILEDSVALVVVVVVVVIVATHRHLDSFLCSNRFPLFFNARKKPRVS